MKVNLNIEEDEQFRAYVKELIGGQVRAVLREQLHGIVAAEISKLRLLNPNNPQLSEMVAAQIQRTIGMHVSQAGARCREEIQKQAREAVQPYVADIKKAVREALSDAITTIVK